jgi:hypothetical protein
MNEVIYRRITDWNHSIYGENQTSFEAGFYVSRENAIYFHGRIIDSHGLEIAHSDNSMEFGQTDYERWNPDENLESIINAIDLQTVETEPEYFYTPACEISIEVGAPVASPKVLRTTIHMGTRFKLLGNYEWQDSGHISFAILCKKEHLLEFFRALQNDFSRLNQKYSRPTTFQS